MDHPSRLELIHILYGLSASDGHVHPEEIKIIQTMANYLNVNKKIMNQLKLCLQKMIKPYIEF